MNKTTKQENRHRVSGSRHDRLVNHSSDQIGPKLLELLGVPADHCRSAVITLEAGHAVTVTAEYFVEMEIDPDTDELKTEVRKYSLVEENG